MAYRETSSLAAGRAKEVIRVNESTVLGQDRLHGEEVARAGLKVDGDVVAGGEQVVGGRGAEVLLDRFDRTRELLRSRREHGASRGRGYRALPGRRT